MGYTRMRYKLDKMPRIFVTVFYFFIYYLYFYLCDNMNLDKQVNHLLGSPNIVHTFSFILTIIKLI